LDGAFQSSLHGLFPVVDTGGPNHKVKEGRSIMIPPHKRKPLKWAVCVLFLLAETTIADARSASHAELAQLAQRAHVLLASVQQQLDAGARGQRSFFTEERRFQDAINAVEIEDLGSPPADALLRLQQFDNFVFNAAIDSCPSKARAELRIAKQLLQHADLDLRGKLQSDWTPDLDSVPDC
jgi:hypothetical protein